MQQPMIGFIGAGNMNSAIIGGLMHSGFESTHVLVSDPNPEKLATLSQIHNISTADNITVAKQADVVIIGVKPNHMDSVLEEIAATISDNLVISIAAGIRLQQIAAKLPAQQPIVRVMPNTPCLIGEGAIGMCSNRYVTSDQQTLASKIFATTGVVEVIQDESLMDVVTALSGSGPAYLFYIAEALLDEAVKQGLSEQQAKQLLYHTLSGSASMLRRSELDPAQLRQQVTSPGGTTAAAITVLEDQHVRRSFQAAISAAVQRGIELGK